MSRKIYRDNRSSGHPSVGALPEQRRKALRLARHDYAGGVYYVTQATQRRQRLFGTLIDGRMRLSPAGQMVHGVWSEIPQFFPNYAVDKFIVMPDHVHGIVRVTNAANDGAGNAVGARLCGCPSSAPRYYDYRAYQQRGRAPTEGCPDQRPSGATLFDFMHRFKSLTTARYRHGVLGRKWPRFDGRVWQREYYEHIVRHDAEELHRIRDYIRNNPAHANLLRFGALRYYGNRDLLRLHTTAFLASRSNVGAPTKGCPDRHILNAQCVISGFLSPRERAVLRMCRARGIPTIRVLACGVVEGATSEAYSLAITPFGTEIKTISAERAAWCNQFAMEHADEIVIGHLNPDGMLAFQLVDLSSDKSVTILSGAGHAAAGLGE